MDIFQAAKKNDVNSLADLIRNGSDPNVKDPNGMTPLMLAIDNQSSDAIRFLVKSKVDLNLTDKFGQTALMLAAGRNNAPAVKLLIENRANLNLVSKSRLTAFGFATDNGYKDIADLIKKAGGK